jgi:hypothetical protein
LNNYFNYFTETEEHFRRARGTGLFLFSPLDWALIEAWQDSGVPLEAVLRGIDAAFEKWRAKKSKTQMVNSLAYCAQAVLTEARSMSGAAPRREPAPLPFSVGEVRAYLQSSANALRRPGYEEIASALDRIVAGLETHYADVEDFDRRLTALEEKMFAVARGAQTEEELLAARRELDLQLRPYRGKMTADQLSMLERKFLDRRLLESAGLPRLSLFYIGCAA